MCLGRAGLMPMMGAELRCTVMQEQPEGETRKPRGICTHGRKCDCERKERPEAGAGICAFIILVSFLLVNCSGEELVQRERLKKKVAASPVK